MKIKYTVASVAEQKVTVTAQLAGQDIQAETDGLVVELVSLDQSMGHTLRLVPQGNEDATAEEEMAAAVALFAQDAEITATFALTE